MAHLLVENPSSSSSNNQQITSASSCHWALKSCTLTDPKVIALVCFEQSNYAVHLHPEDKRGYRSIVRLINNDQIFSTINRDYTSVERIGLALTMTLVTEAYNHIVPIAQNAVTGNNARLLDPKTVTIQLGITQEPIFLHGHVFGCGDPERKYIDDVQLDGPILGTLFNMNTSSPHESDHDKKVSWKSEEINKVVRRLETEIENIHHAYKIHGLTIITRNTFFNIYIVRHGETDWNTQTRLQGHTDIALSEKGRLQACQLQEKFAGIHFSKVFSSDLIRARSTAELILGSNKSTIIETPLLRERCLGTWEGRFAGELKSHLEQTIDVDNFTQEEYLSFKWDDTAESYSDAYQRLQTFIRSIAFSTPISDDPILLCSHGDTFVCYDISKSKCTYPNERIYWSYKQVKCLHYIKYKTNRINYSNLLLIQFSNSQHLKITISFDDNFWSFIFSVHRLTTLEAILDENYSHYQLITLWKLSPYLYSLRSF
ncbi:unnamed protein product [Rotaria sp. Silwood2]|nr:unnamed protein product [Rotaria sp. Silwood2]